MAPVSGSLGAARNLEGLRKRNVTHIVNASPIVPCFFRGHFRYKALPVYDDAEEDIARFFADATRFIARVRGPLLWWYLLRYRWGMICGRSCKA